MAQAPNRRDRTRPAELLGLSGVLSIFVGLISFMATRDIILALIFLGVTFILVLVTLATLALTVNSTPTGEERDDLDEQDRGH